jgi:hypothetical protein
MDDEDMIATKATIMYKEERNEFSTIAPTSAAASAAEKIYASNVTANKVKPG